VRDLATALLLGVATAASRIPFMTHRLWEWDSVLYARALEQGFHVSGVLAESRPHPPGYLFYVASAALAKSLVGDSNTALVVVAVAASGVAAASFYLLCRRFAGPNLSLLVSLAFAADPLLWLHGEVAMPYVVLAPLMTILALVFLDARGDARRPLYASLALGALAGFRQDVLLFLAPLWLWMLVPAPWRTRFAAAIALGAACLVWFIPSAVLSDGAAAYIASTVRQFSGLAGVSGNAGRSIALNLILIGWSLAWALLGVTAALAVLGLARALARIRGGGVAERDAPGMLFLSLWVLPALLFYLFVHIGEWGFVTSIVPGLYAMFVWLVRPLAARGPASLRRAGAAFIVANAALGAVLFVGGRDPVFSAASLAEHDAATDAKTAYIRSHFSPEATVVIAGAEVLVARYYLPGYAVWYGDNSTDASYTRSLDRDTTLVVYEPRARPRLAAAFERVDVGAGVTLEVAHIPNGSLAVTGVDIDAGGR
jgi:hypothetical protein